MKFNLIRKYFLFFNSNYCLVRLCQMSYENAKRENVIGLKTVLKIEY